MKEFQIQFDEKLISEIADRYSFQEDAAALEAGKQIQKGLYTRNNFEKIFEWKTRGRGRSRLSRNSDGEIEDALRLAGSAKTDRSAVAVLLGLNGVQVPVASAILTALDPERFTIIDFRALEALGTKQGAITIDYYLKYLEYCRSLSKKVGLSLRTLDRALWQWSKEIRHDPNALV
jgi:thermostable 8-oxoguanine DNA glycosylase